MQPEGENSVAIRRDVYFVFRHDDCLGDFATLVHRRSQPFIVSLYFPTAEGVTEWQCDIELFRQALAGNHAGIGDIQLYPAPEDPTKLVVYLTSEEAYTELLVDVSDIEAFCKPIKVSAVESRMWVNWSLRQTLGI